MSSSAGHPPSPATQRPPGVRYASTSDGTELPVIDVTHPAFALPDRADVLRAIDDYATAEAQRSAPQRAFRRLMFRLFLRRSVLARAIQGAAGSFLPALPTYLMKLGPENLPGFATDVDRRIAASPPVLAVRLRLFDVAMLLTEGLAPALAAAPSAPLHLVDIGGGPAADALNALVLLRKEHPRAVEHRAIRIHVLDREAEGPAFGARALDALRAEGGPLAGLEARLEHVPYDWADTSVLDRVVAEIARTPAVWACSAEGSLFDYGSDDEIVANLRSLDRGTPAETFVVGSVTRRLRAPRASGVNVRPRSRDEFAKLVAAAGWKLERVLETAITYHVRLRKAAWTR